VKASAEEAARIRYEAEVLRLRNERDRRLQLEEESRTRQIEEEARRQLLDGDTRGQETSEEAQFPHGQGEEVLIRRREAVRQ